VEINPNFAAGWFYSGWLRLWAGQGDIAIDYFAKASRLSPYEMPARVLLPVGISQFFAGRFDEARATLLRSLQEFPDWPPNYRFLAACYAQMDQLDEARQMIERLRSITSAIVPAATHWRDAGQREFYLSGLRLAAGETT
jgi:adenylate cyclase